MNGAQAISSLMDAGVYTWAASARCGEKLVPAVNEEANCAVDILSATEQIQKFVNVVLATVDACGGEKMSKCGLAGGELAEKLTALGAAGAEVVQECPSDLTGLVAGKFNSQDLLRDPANQVPRGPVPAPPAGVITDPNWNRPNELICAMDVKGGMLDLFKASVHIANAKEACDGDDSRICAYNALGIMEGLGDLGRYVQGAVGHCQQPNTQMYGNYPVHCASAATRLFAKTMGLAAAATKVAVACESHTPTPKGSPLGPISVQPNFGTGNGTVPGNQFNVPQNGGNVAAGVHTPRLYGKDSAGVKQDIQTEVASGSVNYVLAAALPITAVAAFFAGIKLRISRGTTMSRSLEMSQGNTFVQAATADETEAMI
jgi:hypothetical protein